VGHGFVLLLNNQHREERLGLFNHHLRSPPEAPVGFRRVIQRVFDCPIEQFEERTRVARYIAL
jgi:hypothetical protein